VFSSLNALFQATFDEERTQLKGQLLDLRSELDKARASKRELEKKWAGFDADAWQQQQQQQKEMEIMQREKEQEWQEERRHLKVGRIAP
jgi:Skp family chaperone for outer membrane proteins